MSVMPKKSTIAATRGFVHLVAGAMNPARRNHPGRQREMAAGRLTRDDQPIRIEVVLLGVRHDPAQCAAAVFDRRRCERHVREPILHVDHGVAHRDVRQRAQRAPFLGPLHPAAPVDENDRWRRRSRLRDRCARIAPRVDIELPFPSVGARVDDVGHRADLLKQRNRGPDVRRRLRHSRLRAERQKPAK